MKLKEDVTDQSADVRTDKEPVFGQRPMIPTMTTEMAVIESSYEEVVLCMRILPDIDKAPWDW